MFESISRGWSLTKTSFNVLRLDPEIMWLPVLAGILQIVAVIGVGAGAFGLYLLGGDMGGLLGLFLIYVAVYSIVIYFNVAVIEMATIRFNGGDPVLKDGFAKANARLARILQWALVAATVGVILNLLRRQARDNMIARIIVGFLEFGWNVATYFVLPILAFHDLGPMDAIKRSTSTVKRVWGESLTGIVTTGIVFFLLGLIGIVPLALGFILLGANVFVGFALMALAVLYWIALAASKVAIDGILVAALYKYAETGNLPGEFRDAGVQPQLLVS